MKTCRGIAFMLMGFITAKLFIVALFDNRPSTWVMVGASLLVPILLTIERKLLIKEIDKIVTK